MRKMLIVAVAVAGLLLGSAGWLRGGDEDEAFRWERDLAAARARAAREGKPLLVVFRCET